MKNRIKRKITGMKEIAQRAGALIWHAGGPKLYPRTRYYSCVIPGTTMPG